MQFYEFHDGLCPLGEKAPEKWENVLAILEPEEVGKVALPTALTPPLTSDSVYGSQLCAILADQNGITGHIHIPARGSQAARRFAFSWAQGSLLIVDHDRTVAGCLDAIRSMRTHNIGGADGFLADLLLTLVREDLSSLEQLETRITNLEQEVLTDNTDGFIHRMSAVRKELSRENRFYTQLADFGASLLEEADDLFDKHATRRMNYFLRRVEALKNETERLREYAVQVSSEYQSQVDIAQNRVMQLLTIVTTIFLPLSLIVGWYGMNFDMPELEWEYGYPVIIALSVLVVVLLIRYFKRKKWF